MIALVLHQTVAAFAVGVAIGLGGSLALTRLLGPLLWQISATDAPTFVASLSLIVLVGLAGCLIPALRAVAVDPTTALRSE